MVVNGQERDGALVEVVRQEGFHPCKVRKRSAQGHLLNKSCLINTHWTIKARKFFEGLKLSLLAPGLPCLR